MVSNLKAVHSLLISPSDYREWGLSLFDATIQFLTSWQGLTFYAIVLAILLLQLTPLLAMRSKYFVPITILLDSCCWAGYISLFARKADTASHTMAYILQFTLFPLRYYLCLALDSSNIGRYRHPAHLPKGMAAKGAGATADRGDRIHHFHHREEVVATTIGRRVNHYRFAPRTTIGLYPGRVVVCIPSSASPHATAPLRPRCTPR